MMNALRRNRFTLTAITLTALLTGCGGTQNALSVAPSSVTQNVAHVSHGSSWMLPEASSDDLLYVANAPNVLIFSYPSGGLVGEIANIGIPVGLCSDSNGNVFVVNETYGELKYEVLEFPHAGTTATQTIALKEPGGYCDVAPGSNDLAVTTSKDVGAHVEVFLHETQSKYGKSLRDVYGFYGCAHDNRGRLFLDAQTVNFNTGVLSALGGHRRRLTEITVNQPPRFMGQLQWDGRYLAMGNFYADPFQILRVKISHTTGNIIGTTTLLGSLNGRFLIHGHTVIAGTKYPSGVSLYHYPAGGNAFMSLPQEYFNSKRGTYAFAFSVAPSRTRTR